MGVKDGGLMETDDQCDAANLVGCEGGTEIPIVHVHTFVEKIKFYTSLCMGITAFLSVFAFLFLIPFVVDPAISTIVADYEQKPVTCRVVDHVYSEGLKNCSWASCREGCTTAVLKCHQITVSYSKMPFEDFQKHKDLNLIVWTMNETKFFVNTEGCGYPPSINCSEFAMEYGYQNIGKIFPCYYSKTYPEMVVARYSWDENLRHLVLSLLVPIVLFVVSISVLTYWYCPSGQKGCCRGIARVKYPSKEDLNEDFDDDDDDDDDEEEY